MPMRATNYKPHTTRVINSSQRGQIQYGNASYSNRYTAPKSRIQGQLAKARQVSTYLHQNPQSQRIYNSSNAHLSNYNQHQRLGLRNHDPLTHEDRQIIEQKRARRPKRVTVVLGGDPEQKKKPEDFGINVNKYVQYQTESAKKEMNKSKYFKVDPFDLVQNSGYNLYLQKKNESSRKERRNLEERKPRRSKSNTLNNRIMTFASNIFQNSNNNNGTFVGNRDQGRKLAYGNQEIFNRNPRSSRGMGWI